MCLSPVRGNNSYVEARPESEKLKWICRNCWGAIYQQSLPSIFTKIETDLSQHLESIHSAPPYVQAHWGGDNQSSSINDLNFPRSSYWDSALSRAANGLVLGARSIMSGNLPVLRCMCLTLANRNYLDLCSVHCQLSVRPDRNTPPKGHFSCSQIPRLIWCAVQLHVEGSNRIVLRNEGRVRLLLTRNRAQIPSTGLNKLWVSSW